MSYYTVLQLHPAMFLFSFLRCEVLAINDILYHTVLVGSFFNV